MIHDRRPLAWPEAGSIQRWNKEERANISRGPGALCKQNAPTPRGMTAFSSPQCNHERQTFAPSVCPVIFASSRFAWINIQFVQKLCPVLPQFSVLPDVGMGSVSRGFLPVCPAPVKGAGSLRPSPIIRESTNNCKT